MKECESLVELKMMGIGGEGIGNLLMQRKVHLSGPWIPGTIRILLVFRVDWLYWWWEGQVGYYSPPPPPTEISNVAWVWGCLAFLNNVGYICKSQDYHFQRYHSLSDLPLIVVSLYHCLLYCLTPGPVLAFRDTWNAKQEFVLIMQYWFIQAGKKENAGGICKDWWLSNSVGFWDSFCFHFDWV